jgi:hypothetical protein
LPFLARGYTMHVLIFFPVVFVSFLIVVCVFAFLPFHVQEQATKAAKQIPSGI